MSGGRHGPQQAGHPGTRRAATRVGALRPDQVDDGIDMELRSPSRQDMSALRASCADRTRRLVMTSCAEGHEGAMICLDSSQLAPAAMIGQHGSAAKLVGSGVWR